MNNTCLSMKEDKMISWIPTKKSDFFTSDDLIDAYLYGKRTAFEETKRHAINQLNRNIDKSGEISFNLLRLLTHENFTPIDAYLRINSLENFDIMVTVPESDMISDVFLSMYDVVSNIEKQNKEDSYGVFISFCPVNNHFEEFNVSSDGFVLKLAKNGN